MKNFIRILRICIIFLVLVFIILCTKVNAAVKGTITGDTVNVRKKADINSKVVTAVSINDVVEVLEKNGDWYKIKHNNKEGYIYIDYIKVDDTELEINNKLENEDSEVITEIEAKKYLISGSNIKLTPNIISNTILTIQKDESITIIEQINGWSYINIENTNGWVRNEKIKETQENTTNNTTENKQQEEKVEETKSQSKQINKIAYIKYSSVNLRKEPSTDASIIDKLKINTEVTIIEEVDSVWYKAQIGDTIGYISQDLVSFEKTKEDTTSRNGDTSSREKEEIKNTSNTATKQEITKTTAEKTTETNTEKKTNATTSTTKTSSTKGEEIVAYAKKYLGYSYVYGGSSPKTGFDCSGFTSYVYKHFGYTISRSSVGQASEGTKVEKKDLQPGDLVIYKNNALTKIGHVGIYIGDNKMIHASEPGVGVIVTDIDSKAHKYPQRFVMGRRIIK